MSFGFLPAPVYIAMMLFLTIFMLINSIKFYKNGRKLSSVISILFAILGILVLIAKGIQEYFSEYEHYIDMLVLVGGIIFFIGIILIGIEGWKTSKTDPRKRRTIKIIYILFGLWLLLSGVFFGLLFYYN